MMGRVHLAILYYKNFLNVMMYPKYNNKEKPNLKILNEPADLSPRGLQILKFSDT
jgi:hypothetical protein